MDEELCQLMLWLSTTPISCLFLNRTSLTQNRTSYLLLTISLYRRETLTNEESSLEFLSDKVILSIISGKFLNRTSLTQNRTSHLLLTISLYRRETLTNEESTGQLKKEKVRAHSLYAYVVVTS